MVFDALDECSEEGLERVLGALAETSKTDLDGLTLRVLLTSRSYHSVSVLMSRRVEVKFWTLADRKEDEIRSDINVFYRTELGSLWNTYGTKPRRTVKTAPKAEPTEDELRELTARAQWLFQYAETVCRLVRFGHGQPRDRLQ